MIESAYHFCPQCGKPLEIKEHDGDQVQACEQGHVLYKNQNVCIDAVIVRDDKLLLVRRARDPQKGVLDIPGGFVNPDEKPADTVIREVREELHVEAKIIRLLGIYGPSAYPYKGVTYYNCGPFYLVDIGNQTPEPDDDVASIEWFPKDALPKPEELAFTSQQEFMRDILSGKVSIFS